MAAAEKARDEAEARAEAAARERDALAKELDEATQINRDAIAAAGARVDALDAEHQRLMREWQEDAVRLEVALRERDVIAGERDALAAELDALRQSDGAAQAEERARQQEFYDAAEQRIRELELQLLQPQFEVDGRGTGRRGRIVEPIGPPHRRTGTARRSTTRRGARAGTPSTRTCRFKSTAAPRSSSISRRRARRSFHRPPSSRTGW